MQTTSTLPSVGEHYQLHRCMVHSVGVIGGDVAVVVVTNYMFKHEIMPSGS